MIRTVVMFFYNLVSVIHVTLCIARTTELKASLTKSLVHPCLIVDIVFENYLLDRKFQGASTIHIEHPGNLYDAKKKKKTHTQRIKESIYPLFYSSFHTSMYYDRATSTSKNETEKYDKLKNFRTWGSS